MRGDDVAVPLAVGACAAAAAYALSRLVQVSLFVDPDPRTVLVVTRIAFFWRAWIALYAATLVTIGAFALRGRARAAFDRSLPLIVAITVAIAALQGALFP